MQLQKLKENIVQGILGSVFPTLCYSCDRPLLGNENFVCLHCSQDFNFLTTEESENFLHQLFWGKSNIFSVAAIYNYVQGGSIQKLLHQFKYHGVKKLGVFFASNLASEMQSNNSLSDVSHLCYVPSTRRKKLKRGYNQGQVLATELSKITGIPCVNLLEVARKKGTQTTKSVFERHELLDNTFAIIRSKRTLSNPRHILIVDDVITTGATTISCANLLINKLQIKVSVIAVAFRNI